MAGILTMRRMAVGPDSTTLELIHRAPDGYISLHRGVADESGDWQIKGICSLLPHELSGMLWPLAAPHIERDGYAVINSQRRPANHKSSLVPGAWFAKRNKPNTLYLNACFTDIDCWDVGIDPLVAAHRVRQMQEWGKIPPCSMIINSGRGLWLLWLLRDTDNAAMPVQNTYENLRLWNRVQFQIQRELDGLGADAKRYDDHSSLVRIDKSKSSKAGGAVVVYDIQADVHGVFSYTLHELAESFDVTEPDPLREPPPQLPRSTAKCANRINGWRALNKSRLRDVVLLIEMRGGGFDMGCRNHGAFLYSMLLLKNGYSPRETLELVVKFGNNCRPPLSLRACRSTVKSAATGKYSRIPDRKISEWLKITKMESGQLERLMVAEDYPEPTRRVFKNKAGIVRARRDAILNIVQHELGGQVPPIRLMAALLNHRGHAGNKDTVAGDYRALGLQTAALKTILEKRELKAKIRTLFPVK